MCLTLDLITEREICEACTNWTRRGIFGLEAGAGASALMGGVARAAGVRPEEALERLKADNNKYVAAPQLCVVDVAGARARVTRSQAPWATILTCSDSRVTPEMIFGGVDPGELFVARNAGNIADADVVGSIEYAVEHLGSALFVVMGHQRCGAVSAACDVAAKGTKFPGAIGRMLEAIVPAALNVKGKDGDFVDNAVRENARRNAIMIRANSEIVADRENEGKIKIAYARFDLETGVVDFLG